jgi:hypothetical protein
MSQILVTGEAKIREIQGPVVANSGVITALDGAASQYVRGDGTLADFPTSTGGGSSVSYYLNSSVSQGTIGGVAYRQLGKTPISGAGTDITASTNGYIANYITDSNDPSLLEVPAGNFNCEFYFSVNSNNHNPYVYAELYKYDGTTFTLLGSSQSIPEYLTNGTTLSAYYFAIPVAVAALTITDRLAIRIYANVDTRVVTLHTENSHLCQVVTTFSKGLTSLNNLTRQVQFLGTGTSGTDFAISSSVATHTFNLPVASAANTGKLSSTDWSTFNNKQNTITDPITGTGASTQIAYFNSGTSITSEAAFNYDASLNRLGVNTSVPNATIGANAALDSGYSLLLKNDNANYNSIGFATDSTYGNVIQADRTGAAPSRNLTLYNYAGFVSITESGNLGIGLLTPNNGIDIYNSTNSQLWLHNAASGVTSTDGVRLALFNNLSANLRNFDGPMSIASEGDFTVLTLGAENIRVNSTDGKVGIGNPATVPEMLTVNGSIQQSGVLSSLLKTNGDGKLIAAVAGTDYVIPSALSGYVPTSRTLTINGVGYDLSANRSWTITSDITGSGADGRVAYWNGTNSITSEAGFIYDASTNRLGVNTSVPNATIGGNSALDSGYGLLIKTGASNYNGIGLSIDSTYGNLISTEKLGTASARNLTLLNQSGFVSLKENGNFGVNTLNPSVSGTGIDIYGSTSTSLRLHTATSGTTVSDGAGINFSAANNLGITNYEAGTIDIVTNGNSGVFVATNGFVGINGATPSVALTVTGSITQTSVTSSLLKTDSGGLLVAAVAGTDYVIPSALSGYVPTSRTLTINGTSYDLSANRSWTIATGVTGTGTTDYIPKFTGSTSIGNSAISEDATFITLNSRALSAPRARFNTGYDNASLSVNIFGQTYMDSRTSRLYNTFNLSSMSNYMHIYDPYSTVNANGGFSIGASSSITTLPTTSIIHFDGVNNRVGIGTTAPSATLSVNGASYFSSSVTIAGGNFLLGGTSRLLYSNGSTVNNIYSGGTDGLRVMNQADSAILVTIANTGAATFSSSVGIGVSPAKTLDVYNSGNTNTAQIKVGDGGSTARAYLGTFSNNLYLSCGGTYASGWTTDGTNGIANIGMDAFNGGSTITFATAASNTSPTERMRIDSSGNFIFKNDSTTNQEIFYGLSQTNGNCAVIRWRNTGLSIHSYGQSYGSQLMIFPSSANVGIGTTTDNGSKLQVNGSVTASSYGGAANIGVRGAGANGISDGPFYQLINTTNSYQILSQINANTDYDLWAFRGSWTKIGTTSATTGVYTPLSDRNKKKDFEDSTIGLDAILGLKPTLYRMIDEDETSQKQLGFIAQEVKDFIPQAYVEQENFIGLQDRPIIAALVKAVQELEARIKQLENK